MKEKPNNERLDQCMKFPTLKFPRQRMNIGKTILVDAYQSSHPWPHSKRAFSQPAQQQSFKTRGSRQDGTVPNVLPSGRPCVTPSKHFGVGRYRFYGHIWEDPASEVKLSHSWRHDRCRRALEILQSPLKLQTNQDQTQNVCQYNEDFIISSEKEFAL